MDKQSFFELYAPMAIEQQQKFGIPASVTLAQMALESGWGEGRAIKEGNNAFCVKGSYNGQYVLISDNAKNEKFRKYETLAQSFDDHSRLLMKDRYRQAPGSDYKVWTAGIQKGGYAYPPDGYAEKLNSLIESNSLQRYDVMGLSPAQRVDRQVVQPWGQERGRFSMPLGATDGSLVMTSDIGHRNTGIAGASHDHNGLDLRAQYVPVFATETGGKVIKAEHDGNSKSGKHVIVEYERDGHKFTVSYCHLSKVDVKPGDIVTAGQPLGVSGNSSYRDYTKEKSLDPHLHLTVRRDGEIYDPKKYLAEIAVRGGIDTTLVRKGGNGNDLLASMKQNVVIPAYASANVQGAGIAQFSVENMGWINQHGHSVNVGEVRVSKLSDLVESVYGRSAGQLNDAEIDRILSAYPSGGQRDVAKAFLDRIKTYINDGSYADRHVMTADIDGRIVVKDISKDDYDKFLASSEAGKMSLFDKVYDDIAMNQGQDDSQMAQNRFEALLNLAKGNGNIQDFMSMFLNKYGDGSSLGSSGDFLADLIGTMIAGFINMVVMFDESDEDKVKQLHEMLDARMSNEDQAKVDKMKRDGVDPGQAKMLSQANTEAGLTANDQQQSQQQQITMRG